MKRKILSLLIIVGLMVLGVLGFEYFGTAESATDVWGFSKTYDSLEEIKTQADLVVRGHIPLYYDIREIGEEGKTTKQAFYEVTINEVLLDRTGHGFDEQSEIVVNQVIGFKEAGREAFTSETGMHPMKTGEYLLFLNKVTHPTDGKVYYVSNSRYHLYKFKDKNTFKNIASDQLLLINYSDLIRGNGR